MKISGSPHKPNTMFRIGIIGAGWIAEKMALALAPLKDIETYAIASRSMEKAEAFARKHNIPMAYGSYEAMLGNPDIDLVYIATPHSHHFEHSMLALEHGKPVLVEKAFTANSSQAEKLISTARESGGALLDLGVYALNFARMYFGTDIVRTVSNCHLGPTGMDMHECISLSFADGKMANLQSGALCLNDRQGIISGTEGYIRIDNINCPERIEVWRNYELVQKFVKPEDMINGYEYQVIECKRCIEAGLIESPMMPHEESISIMKQMDALREEWGVEYPYDKL